VVLSAVHATQWNPGSRIVSAMSTEFVLAAATPPVVISRVVPSAE